MVVWILVEPTYEGDVFCGAFATREEAIATIEREGLSCAHVIEHRLGALAPDYLAWIKLIRGA